MNLPLSVPPRENVSSRVQASIREAIMSAQFEPGEKLNIRALAGMLGTSATPIREALAHLAAEGAIEMRPGYSAKIPLFSLQKYQELCTIRKAVEGLASAVAATKITSRQLAELNRILQKFRLACQEQETILALKYSREFRFAVYRVSRMPILIRTIEGLMLQCAPMFRLAPPTNDPKLAQAYQEVIDALTARDSMKATATIEKTIELGYNRLLETIGRAPAAGEET